MHTRKADRAYEEVLFKLMPALICFVAILFMVAACGDGAFKDPSTLCGPNSSAEEGSMTETLEITDERNHAVIDKHVDLIKRQPNYYSVGSSYLVDENGEETDIRGIVIRVTEKADQSTLPAEDRIPDCLEGVPVQIVKGPGTRLLFELLERHG